MITQHTLKNNFPNTSIISIDELISTELELNFNKFTVFCDKNFNVKSVNILNLSEYDFNFEKQFSVLNKEQIKELEKLLKVHNKDFNIKSKTKFSYGKVIKRQNHPKSEKLFVLQIQPNPNSDESIQVVTNTLNSTEGKILVFAYEGAKVHSGLIIKNGEVVNVKSYAMLSGYETLGLEGTSLIFGDESNWGKEFNF
ncbi:TyrS-associated PheT N-terminal domain-related protein TapR [Mycoplasmopsis alligatoris]|uniref:tRNA-binding domain-containing protein n=1 Tax=Mycoplasmopsis alligatoris A21JP2 TaxID=747682 RepID=D4XWD1_9BACT|nr:hypothetical protein [Mycoplasmopsis alligatoris]EFF41290.1 conserved hypothetical protein [Mycoplasmopsis alligatoris A21JP2]